MKILYAIPLLLLLPSVVAQGGFTPGFGPKLPDLDIFSNHHCIDVEFKPNSNHIAWVCEPSTNSKRVIWYSYTESNEFTRLPNPSDSQSIFRTNGALEIKWSHNTDFLAIGKQQSVHFVLYKQNGNSLDFIQGFGVGASVRGIAWTPNDEYFSLTAGACNDPSSVRLMKMDGDSFSQVFAGADITGCAQDMDYHPNNMHLAIAVDNAGGDGGNIAIRKRNGDSLSSVSSPSLPQTSGAPRGVAWNESGEILAVSHTHSPRLQLFVFNESAQSWGPSITPSNQPSGIARELDWNTNSNFLAVPSDSDPWVALYERSGTDLTRLADPPPANRTNDHGMAVSFSRDDSILAEASGLTGPPSLGTGGIMWAMELTAPPIDLSFDIIFAVIEFANIEFWLPFWLWILLIFLAEWKRDALYFFIAALLGIYITIIIPEIAPDFFRTFTIIITLYLSVKAYIDYQATRPIED